jgi:hypothetical protein
MFSQEELAKPYPNSNINNIQDFFHLPISFNTEKKQLDSHIITDLELVTCLDKKSTSIYSHVFNPSNCLGKQMLTVMPNYYTTDKAFLKDTQHILKSSMNTSANTSNNNGTEMNKKLNKEDFENVINIYDEIKNDPSFKEKYYYLDWQHLLFLNKCDWFMQLMSMYNLASPAFSLFLPIIILIIPFFVIKLKGDDLSTEQYIDILKKIIANHTLGKVFTQFNTVDTQQKIYLLMSAAFYVFSIYQNVLVCVRFNNNMKRIYGHLDALFKYLNSTIEDMQNFIAMYSILPSYQPFITELQVKLIKLQQIQSKLYNIKYLDSFTISFSCLKQIGYVMTEFYEIYENEDYHHAFMYSFGFNGYMDNINGLRSNISDGKMNYCEFTSDLNIVNEIPIVNDKKNKKDKNCKKPSKREKRKKQLELKAQEQTIFKNAYYPALIGKDPIKNSYNLNKNLIITGPNASGKTTMLKSTLINLVISQQFGCGCYDSANIKPYKHIHCYLNIPDTIGRDSLLQAEARRCKEIIDAIINNDKNDTHFCVFDELYSGTNPEEAILSAYVVMDYLANHPTVSTILTTHYVKLCKKLSKNPRITNCHMKVLEDKEDSNKFEYLYSLEEGISEIKGGIKVLIDMNYPQEIIDKTGK